MTPALASSLHIPLGTLLFATTLVVAVLLLVDRDGVVVGSGS